MEKVNNQYRIALFILDSALSNAAVSRFIKLHTDAVRLVIVSNPFRKHGGGGSKNLLQLVRHSGIRFSWFLAYSFLFFPLLLQANYLLCRIFGRTSNFIPIKQHCQRYAIACHRKHDVNDGQTIRLLHELDIDLIITCFFDQIIGDEIIRIPHKACVNVHPGLLPECRGVFPEIHTAAGKCADFGITIHTIDNATIDTGRVLLKRNISMSGRYSMLATGRRLLAEGLAAVEEVLADVSGSLEKSMEQGAGNYFSYPSKADIRDLNRQGYVLMTMKDITSDISRTL